MGLLVSHGCGSVDIIWLWVYWYHMVVGLLVFHGFGFVGGDDVVVNILQH